MTAMRFPLSLEKLEERIREIEPLKTGFDNLTIHTVITDENANILYANQAVLRQTGWKPEEIIGKNPGDVWGGRMSQSFYENMWRTIKWEKEPFVGEVENMRRGGELYWQELIISPILDRQGNVRFFIGVEPDVTERKQMEKFRTEFVSALAHQLNAPLSAIRWAVELLKTQGGLSDVQSKHLEGIYKQDLMLIDLISDLLVVARIGKLTEHTETMELSGELKQIVDTVQTAHPNVTLEFDGDGPCPIQVSTKSVALQVFVNLITNAAKYSATEHGWAKVKLAQTPDKCVVTVENNGPPIKLEEQKLVFSKLYRGTTALERGISGTGLGLYICKLICDTFEWKISFQSPTPEGNTRFTVEIPDHRAIENPAK